MDPQLLIALILGIATVVLIVLRTRLDAFVGLLAAGLVTGFVAGTPATDVLNAITGGFGSTLASIGIVIGLGIGLGKILEVSGAADALARAVIRLLGKGREPWAMAGTGALISIPVFCDSGYIIMNPLARSIARRRRAGYVTLALALGCGMTLTHHLLPPTPGPLGAAGILGADIGALIGYGLIFTVILLPIVVIYARWIGPKLEPHLNAQVRQEVYAGGTATVTADRSASVDGAGTAESAGTSESTSAAQGGAGGTDRATEDNDDADIDPARALGPPPEGARPHRVSAWLGSLPLLVPLLLIVTNTVATAIDKNAQGVLGDDDNYSPSTLAGVLSFVGNPVIALIIGLVLAVYVLLPRWVPRNKVGGWLSDAAAAAGLIILITGAGGAFGEVLRTTGVGDQLANAIASWSIPGVLVPFLIASLVRIAQGSGTVAMITAASVTAPMIDGLGVSPVLAVLACCAGSMVFSYFNDSYFWVVTRFTGLDGLTAIRGWSGITTAVWLGSLPLLLLASAVI